MKAVTLVLLPFLVGQSQNVLAQESQAQNSATGRAGKSNTQCKEWCTSVDEEWSAICSISVCKSCSKCIEINAATSMPSGSSSKVISSTTSSTSRAKDASITTHVRLGVACGPGSPSDCSATPVAKASGYSAGRLVRITNGLQVKKSDQRNSCPTGYKIWSPRSRRDWIIVFNALGQNIRNYPRQPHLIVDVTRALDKCDTCDTTAMKSSAAHTSWWRTSDGSPWWLRDSVFPQPSDQYRANCYLSVYDVYPDHVKFEYGNCSFSSTDYLCQEKCVAVYPDSCSNIHYRDDQKPVIPLVGMIILVLLAITSFTSTAVYVICQHCRWPKHPLSSDRHRRNLSEDQPSPNPNDDPDPSVNPHRGTELPVTGLPVALDISSMRQDVTIPVAAISSRAANSIPVAEISPRV